MSRPFCSHVALLQYGASSGVLFVNKLAMPLVDFKTNVIKWKFHFVSCNFDLKSNLCRVPNKASCAWEHNLMRFRILGKKSIKN